VLLDIRMNGVDGVDIARQLEGIPETEDVPLIAMSGYLSAEKENRLRKMKNFKACIRKPFAVPDLINQIEDVLNAPRRAGTCAAGEPERE